MLVPPFRQWLVSQHFPMSSLAGAGWRPAPNHRSQVMLLVIGATHEYRVTVPTPISYPLSKFVLSQQDSCCTRL